MAAQKYENLKKVGIVFQGKDICFFLKKNTTRNLFFSKKRYQKPQISIFKINLKKKYYIDPSKKMPLLLVRIAAGRIRT